MNIHRFFFALPLFCMGLTMTHASGHVKDVGRIMFLGNSFTEGHDSPNLSWRGGSRKVVEDILTERGVKFTFVGRSRANSEGMGQPWHNGYGGAGINDLLSGVVRDGTSMGRLQDWIKDSKPDAYIIDIGRKEEEGSTMRELKSQFRKVTSVIYSANPRAKVVWSEQTAPKPVWFPKAAIHLKLVNHALSELAREETLSGRTMNIAKAASGWNPDVHLDHDGVHPSDKGYRYLGKLQAELLLKSIDPMRRA